MTERHTIQIFIAVNESGDSRMSWDSASDAIDTLRDEEGFEAVRVVEINTTIDLPVAEVVNVAIAIPPETKSPAQVTVSGA